MTTTIPQHLSTSNERYTPKEVIEPIRAALGGVINLDPASCWEANKVVKAERYFSPERNEDGLTMPWYGSMFCNPPYGKHANGISNQLLWTLTICQKYARGEFDQLILLVNAAMGDSFFRHIWANADLVCFPSKRIRFNDQNGNPLPQPPNANVLAYFGKRPTLVIANLGKLGAVTMCLNQSEMLQ